MFELPSGYQPPDGAPLARSVTPRELNGAIELAVSEALNHPSKAEVVSRVLDKLIARIGDTETNANMMSELSVADRTYALIQLGLALGHTHYWRSAICRACDECFDISIDLTAIEAAARPVTFPEIRIEASPGLLLVRAPTGADQSSITDIESAEEACRQLLERCLRRATGGSVDLGALSEQDVEAISAAFDKLAFGVPLNATARCPKCKSEVSVPFEPLDWVTKMTGTLLDQVHTIASAYHWPESEILSLPRHRRLSYLRLINAPGQAEPQ